MKFGVNPREADTVNHSGEDRYSHGSVTKVLSEESTQYLFALRAFLFNQRTKTHDPRIQPLIDHIDEELCRRQKVTAGPVR